MFKIIVKDGNVITNINELETEQKCIEWFNSARSRLPLNCTYEIINITAEVEQAKINAECLKYLADTDWYVIRAADEGVQIPEEIRIKRAECRRKIIR